MIKSKKGQPAAEDSSRNSRNEDLAGLIRRIFEGRDGSAVDLEGVDKKVKGFLADMEQYSSLKIKDDLERYLIEEVINLKNEEKLDLRGLRYEYPKGGIPWETVAHCAAEKGHLALLVVLDKYGADIDMRDMEYKRPIHRAIKYGHQDVFHYLLNHPKVQLNRVTGSLGDYAFNSATVVMYPHLGTTYWMSVSHYNAARTAIRFAASPVTGASSEEIMEDAKSWDKELKKDLLRLPQRLTRTDVDLEYYADKHQKPDFLEQIQRKKSQLNTGAAEDKESSMAEDANSKTSQLAKAIPINNAIPITLEEGSNRDLVYAESILRNDSRAAEDVKFLKVQESPESSEFLIESKKIVNSTTPLPAEAVLTTEKEAQDRISKTGILAVAAIPKTTTEKERVNALEEQFGTIPEVPTHEPNLKPVSVVPNPTPEPAKVKKLNHLGKPIGPIVI